MIEILSPSTAKHDMLTKFRLYQKSGVREYWIVDPERRLLSKHVLVNGQYIVQTYGETDTVPGHVLEELELDLSEIFPEEDSKQAE